MACIVHMYQYLELGKGHVNQRNKAHNMLSASII